MRGMLALALLATAACEESRTEILVVVDSDMAVPGEINGLVATVTDPDGETHTSMAMLGGENPPLPRTLGIVWDGGPLEPVTVRVVGQIGGVDVVERSARTAFIKHKTLVLLMELNAACELMSVRCTAEQTCIEGSCRPNFVDPAALPEWNGQVPGRDGGPPPDDAGGDDGGVDDGGPDSATDGAVDGCVARAEECNGRDDDCDMMVDEDFDFTSNPMHCGGCGNACSLPHGMAGCMDSMCVLTGCDMGFDDCDMDPTTGCEADLSADPDHCGMCDMACAAPDRDCCDGACGRC